MNIETDKRIEPTLVENIHSALATEVNDDQLSADTLKALEEFGRSNGSDGIEDDEFDFDLDDEPEATADSSPNGHEDDQSTDVEPPSDLSSEEMGPDVLSAGKDDLEPEEIKPTADDVSVSSESLDDTQDPQQQSAQNPVDVPRMSTRSFGAADTAQDFLDSKMSLNDLVRQHLSSSSLGSAPQQQVPTPTQANQPHLQGQVVQGQAAVADERNRMSLGAGAMMLGSKGVNGLGTMLSSGGKAVNSAISDFSFGRAERELGIAITEARASLTDLRNGGLSILESDTLGDDEKKEMLKQYLATPENQIRFDALVNKVDRMTEISGKLVAKGVEKDMDGDVVLNRAIDPVHQFMKDNDKLLKNLSVGDKSLHERLEGAVTTLLESLRDLMLQIAAVFTSQSAATRSSGPSLG